MTLLLSLFSSFTKLQPVETCGYREITMFDEALRHQTVVSELAATKRFHKPQKRPRSTVVYITVTFYAH